ncbi:HNH endonuclease [Ceratobasidium sp. AG-Ba]|nr:HNH endonuclease [Ceratobasidium sp. AG-Ba]QRV98876.1 HNH endonuclease [Ceratobasidium sp. AG-Ba]
MLDRIEGELRKASPTGGLCAITRTDEQVRVCQLLSKDTSPEKIKILEFAWGLESGTLNMNNTRNMIILQDELSNGFLEGDWALVPTMKTLEKFDSRKLYTYEFASWKETPNWGSKKRNPESRKQTPPLIRSHAHPCFVICNAALKTMNRKYSLEGELSTRAELCRGLYRSWLGAKPRSPPSPEPSASTSSHFTLSPVPNMGLKRKRDDGGLVVLRGSPGAKRPRKMQAQSLGKLGTTRGTFKSGFRM